ncbi:MAG: aspartate carbamoyltransferase catalytic subunit, partial [Phycisphaerales bacterium]|nr:aspartate carbamoyltransferase catalytic subunit [Phycisphaerales bacterium]
GAHLIADHVSCSVVNAGDGGHEHPTQGLLDALSLGEATGRTDWNFEGLHVLIVGDVMHWRVARSNIACLTGLGARVTLVGPPLLVPRSMECLGCEVSHDLDGLAPGADAIMTLRVQFERGATLASAREYCEHYALTRERAARTRAFFMHPGPMNRGLEIDEDVAKSERSLILQQVANGVRVRMAVLERAAG